MNRTELAIDRYLEYYGEISLDTAQQFFGIKTEDDNKVQLIRLFQDMWDRRGFSMYLGKARQYYVRFKNIRAVSKAIGRVVK